MSIFCITRKTFLDREFDFEKLTMLAEMLREWSGICTSGVGSWHCEARVYTLPRADLRRVRSELQAELAVAAIDDSDEDELKVIGKPTALGYPIDLDVWKAVLNDPVVRGGCVILRLMFDGEVVAKFRSPGSCKAKFAMCGERYCFSGRTTNRLPSRVNSDSGMGNLLVVKLSNRFGAYQ